MHECGVHEWIQMFMHVGTDTCMCTDMWSPEIDVKSHFPFLSSFTLFTEARSPNKAQSSLIR